LRPSESVRVSPPHQAPKDRICSEGRTIVDDRYELLALVGSGGMAEIYLARDVVLDREVALKLLKTRYAQDEEFVERFRREAKSAASLASPYVVPIFDRGETDDGTYYIAPWSTCQGAPSRTGSKPREFFRLVSRSRWVCRSPKP
jgi:hypothetical protein